MKEKFTKNNIITSLLIIGVAFFVVGQFSPVSTYTHSEFASQTFDDWDYKLEWKQFCYNLFSYSYLCDSSYIDIGEKPIVQERIIIFNIYSITLSYDERPSMYGLNYFETSPYVGIDTLFLSYTFTLISFLVAIITIYYFIKFLKDINKKHTKVPFFLGILYLSFLIMIHLGNFFIVSATDLSGAGRANYVKLGLGFYYQLVVAIILFLIYFIQNKPKFLKKKDNLKDIF